MVKALSGVVSRMVDNVGRVSLHNGPNAHTNKVLVFNASRIAMD